MVLEKGSPSLHRTEGMGGQETVMCGSPLQGAWLGAPER